MCHPGHHSIIHSVSRRQRANPQWPCCVTRATAQGTMGTKETFQIPRVRREGQGHRPGEESQKSDSQICLNKRRGLYEEDQTGRAFQAEHRSRSVTSTVVSSGGWSQGWGGLCWGEAGRQGLPNTWTLHVMMGGVSFLLALAGVTEILSKSGE